MKSYLIFYLSCYRMTIFIWFVFTCNVACTSKTESLAKPEDSRFTKVVLATGLVEPMQFEILKDGRVLIAERKGKIKVYDPSTSQVKVIGDFKVSVGYYKDGKEISPSGEDGMQGVILDPDFYNNHRIYVFYTPMEGRSTLLAHFLWDGDSIDFSSRKILLEVPNQRESCCHLGGGMVFDSHGNLYLSTGDNTPNGPDGFPNLDERPGRKINDSQRSSSNTNDLRGKILRIRPEDNGSYTIPEGNLFPPGTPNTLPEIYTMGNRNPYRLSIDSKTGFLFWGEVGPNGIVDSVGRGPKSYDEFNQARRAANFGWPYAAGNNQAYWDYDFATGRMGEKFDPAHPTNTSPNNTGLKYLPPSQSALIWYPQTFSPEFPLLGTGSASAMGGPIYRQADFKTPKRPFPAYYEGKWFITDWSRGWIMAVTLDEESNYKSMERFMPALEIQGPNDMEFGPEGDLYVLQYGRGPYKGNPEAQLFKIEYNSGNRKPVAKISANKRAGVLPLQVSLSSKGSFDYDQDSLQYKWHIVSGTKTVQTFNVANPRLILSQPGLYTARLEVKDPGGAIDTASIKLAAGNEPPTVNIAIKNSNATFYFPDSAVRYSVNVSDKEDGSLADKGINPSQVFFSIDYVSSQGLDFGFESMSETHGIEANPVPIAVQLLNQSDCKSCHVMDKTAIGPGYLEIAEKYKNDNKAISRLVGKILNGGSGVWGPMEMPPHPTMSENDATKIVTYILNLNKEQKESALPLTGKYMPSIPKSERIPGNIVLRAAFVDKGTSIAPPQPSVATVVLRSQVLPAVSFDFLHEVDLNPEIFRVLSSVIPKGPGSYVGFKSIDLTGIKLIDFAAIALPNREGKSAGIIEIRIDSPTGEIIGTTDEIVPPRHRVSVYSDNVERVRAPIKQVKGKHDIYFVIKTSAASRNRMQIADVKFSNTEAEGG